MPLKCGEIFLKLVEIAKQEIRNGRTTERQLARRCGLSQPHMHNILKGVRRLSPASADHLLAGLQISFADVLWWQPGDTEPGMRAVPVVRERVGPGSLANLSVVRGTIGLPRAFADKLTNPVALRLAPDPGLPSPLRPNDMVVIDCNPALPATVSEGGYWVVAEGAGLRVRYLKFGSKGGLTGMNAASSPADTELVRGRIVWISRELETSPTGPPVPSGPGH